MRTMVEPEPVEPFPSTKPLRVAVAIATADRPDVLADTLDYLLRQSVAPAEILLCPADVTDVDQTRAALIGPILRIVAGARGASMQRNAMIAATDADIILFLDDDFLPAADFIGEVVDLFQSHPSIVVATGAVMADGIHGKGLSFAEADAILATAGPNAGGEPVDIYNAYGCNMAVRMETVRTLGVRFDEALPLYAWLEDIDFCRLLAPAGRIVRSGRLRGVHLGTKRSGRSPGKRLGYSQIANPIYLARKGTMEWPRALDHMARNLMANFIRSVSPEPWIDRRGRLIGNLLALNHLIRRRISPDFALQID